MIISNFKLRQYENLIRKEIQEERLPLIGEIIVTEASLLCPVGKYKSTRVGGRLRGSITWATFNDSSDVKKDGKPQATDKDKVPSPNDSLRLWIGTNVEYASYVEYGTRGRKGKSYLRAGLRKAKGQIKEILDLKK